MQDSSREKPIPVSELVIGMKCGGSDGLSGITANPTVGRFSDMMAARGGSICPDRSAGDVRCGRIPDEPLYQ